MAQNLGLVNEDFSFIFSRGVSNNLIDRFGRNLEAFIDSGEFKSLYNPNKIEDLELYAFCVGDLRLHHLDLAKFLIPAMDEALSSILDQFPNKANEGSFAFLPSVRQAYFELRRPYN